MSLYDVWDHAISEVLAVWSRRPKPSPPGASPGASQVVRTQESNFWLGGSDLRCIHKIMPCDHGIIMDYQIGDFFSV